MYAKTGALVAALITGCVLAAAPAANAAQLPPHERTYTAPDGAQFTVGHRDHQVRPAASLNLMPTNRDVFVDNTFYGRVSEGTGLLKAGYLVACAVDLTTELDLHAGIDMNADLRVGLSLGVESLVPNLDLGVGPSLGAGLGVDLTLEPGKVTDVPAGEHALTPGSDGYVYSRDRHIHVAGCGGPLTVQPYALITVDTTEVSAEGAVVGDPFTM
ncbi:MspA family porin [Nocardia shimofusensis]|uniref:MspA family porin n=1 Tax=Nocardia shimofusensis TaxID=228596 RepID=UPI00082FF17D|nr:MspA family porin [Nocardia shimofusensis]